LGRAGDDPEHRHERRGPRAAGGKLRHFAADAFYVRFIRAYATNVMRLEPDGFDGPITPRLAKSHYEEEMEEAFPQDPAVQLAEVLKSMARAWEGTSARLLRQAQGAPSDAGLGLVVQRMARGPGKGLSGAGVIQFVSSDTGEPQVTGATCRRGRGARRCRGPRRCSSKPTKRGPALEDDAPDQVAELRPSAHSSARACARRCRSSSR
jgi:pyruvate,orthophosphate dikinase